jgi:hypothetical protein
MAIKTSGSLGLEADIVNEFGGGRPHSLSEYYRNGSLVPNSSVNNNVPTTGPISFSSFYGATRFFTTTINVPAISTTEFAQACQAQNTPGDIQPGVGGNSRKYYFRTFQGFDVQASGTEITIPPTSILIRGDKAGGCSGTDHDTGIRNPGLEIVYRENRFSPAVFIQGFRSGDESTGENNRTSSVPGGTFTCNSIGFYTIRRVADVFSSNIDVAPVNIFISAAFDVSTFGVATPVSSTGEGWG